MSKLMMRSIAQAIATAFALLALIFSISAHADDDYLAPDVAFKISGRMLDANTAAVTFAIADGYYMYRERFEFQADGAGLGVPSYPKGKIKFDDTFQKDVETYRHSITITVPVQAAEPFTLRVMSQGCADQGLCYAPMESTLRLAPPGKGGLLAALATAQGALTGSQAQPAASTAQSVPLSGIDSAAATSFGNSESGRIESSLRSGKLIAILPLFFLLGLGLAFTPCVLPMVPILSTIILGEGNKVSRQRGLLLSATYALGMAIVYTALGIAAGLAGEGLAAALQNPWVLTGFALLMAALALSMLGVYTLQMPAAIQLKLAQISTRQTSGRMAGVFIMGALSALIVSPCVAAPLAGALVYISQTRDVLIGGSALFVLALGMSVPLLLVGISAGTLLPRAGQWMEAVKRFFGVLMLALALWIAAPALPAWALMLGWALLSVAYGVYLLRATHAGWLGMSFGLAFILAGSVQFIGMATGSRDALAPLAHLSAQGAHQTPFVRVRSSAELDAALAQANGKTVMLDFYADWCVSCKEMEKLTFTDAAVQTQLATMVLLQADVTANNADDKALLKRFNLFGPPGIIFFDKQRQEVSGARVIGYQNAEKFLQSMQRAIAP